MGLVQRLRRLDERAMKSLRRPDESAEVFLRRFAEAGFPENRFLLIEVQRALREHFAQDRL